MKLPTAAAPFALGGGRDDEHHQRREAEGLAEREHDRAGVEARRYLPERDHPESGGRQHDRRGRSPLRPDDVRDATAEQADGDHDRRVQGEERAGAGQSELACVERAERSHACEADHRRDEHQTREDGGAMDERAAPAGPRSGADRHRLCRREPDQRRREGRGGGNQPHGVEAVLAQDELAEQRADGEPAPRREGVEAHRLAAASVGRQVVHHRRRGHEDERFTHACDETQSDQGGHGAGDRVQREARPEQQRAGDDEGLAADAISEPSAERLQKQRRRACGGYGEPDPDAARAELALRVERQHGDQHPDAEQRAEGREARKDEGAGQEAVRDDAILPGGRPARSRLTGAAAVRQDHVVELRRWHAEPVEQLTAQVGRQMVHTETMTVARIHLGAGAVVPRHSHENEQVATVLEGRLRFVVGDEEVVVGAGESLALPANVPHEVEALEDSLVLDVFSPVREDWVRGDDAYLRG